MFITLPPSGMISLSYSKQPIFYESKALTERSGLLPFPLLLSHQLTPTLEAPESVKMSRIVHPPIQGETNGVACRSSRFLMQDRSMNAVSLYEVVGAEP